jgi:hypothetical protein
LIYKRKQAAQEALELEKERQDIVEENGGGLIKSIEWPGSSVTLLNGNPKICLVEESWICPRPKLLLQSCCWERQR